jgi:hypothetical protein
VEFHSLLQELELGQRHLEPSDPNAFPLASGAAITCDGREAEISLPPIDIRSGFSFEAATAAEVEGQALASTLSPDYRLEGYSTHLSVATPLRVGEHTATDFVGRFAVPMMLLMDRRTSPGLLVRPRPGRTELGGEFVVCEDLAAALVFAVAAVRWCARRAGSAEAKPDLPPIISAAVVPDPERFGWYVDRGAFGDDLYSSGRGTILRLVSGERRSAQDVLADAWDAVRPEIATDAKAEELAAVDALVDGQVPLPMDRKTENPFVVHSTASASSGRIEGHPIELRPRRRLGGGLELAPIMVTWETALFLLVDGNRRQRAIAVVPRPALERFVRLLDEGELDGVLSGYLVSSVGRRLLHSYEQTLTVGLYDEFAGRRDLLPGERDPTEQLAYVAV